MRLDEYLTIDEDEITCRKCGYVYCRKDQNYKLFAAELERSFEEVGLLRRPQSELIDRRVVFRQFFCPGCFTNIENETIVDDAPPLHDKELA